MARKSTAVSKRNANRGVVQVAVGTAEAVSVGVVHLAQTTLVEAVRVTRDIGSELGMVAVRTLRGSIGAARAIGGDLKMIGQGISRGLSSPSKPPVKVPARGTIGSAPRKRRRISSDRISHLPR